MLYREDKYGNKISQLGYGCMRFQRKGTSIDYEEANKQIMLAYTNGVNYYDTAYIYPGSEEFLGRCLEENKIREKVNIATKLPQYIMRKPESIEKTFQEELKRLRTTYIDYYLMHMFTDYSEWENLLNLGIIDWIKRKKEEGSIRYIGFSYHGESSMFLKLLDAYPWDFCQIQYNYLDEHTQAGRIGLETAYKKGIPVIIMEPLRGGKLVNIPLDAKACIQESNRNYTPAEWSFRWLWDQPGVTCILSGMNTEEMIEENCKIASEAAANSFTADDFKVIDDVKRIIKQKEKVGCTGCRYCMPCPKGVDIPGNFHYYNLMYIDKKKQARFEYARNLALRQKPGYASLCVSCGLCEKHCPQHIEIRKKLKEADKALRPWPYKLGIGLARKIMIRKEKKNNENK